MTGPTSPQAQHTAGNPVALVPAQAHGAPGSGSPDEPDAEGATLEPDPQAAEPDLVLLREGLHRHLLEQSINPSAARPAHLAGVSFSQDIFRRMSESGMHSRFLEFSKLRSESQIVATQIILAAQERESEIVEHNMARVFAHVLAATFESMRSFMRTPLVAIPSPQAHSRTNQEGERRPGTGTGPTGGQGSRADEPKESLWRRALVAVVTPQYILLAVAAFFGFATGYSQLKIANLESAIESYSRAADAATTLKDKLTEVNASYEGERSRANQKIVELTQRLAAVENDKHRLELERQDLRTSLDLSRGEIASVRSELNQRRGEESDELQRRASELSALRAEQKMTTEALSKAQVEVAELKADKQILENGRSQLNSLVSERTRQLDLFRKDVHRLSIEVERLRSKEVLLEFSETFIAHMRKEVGPWNDPDEEDIQQYLKEYDARVDAIKKRR